jgi:hypothetical protein
MWKQLLGAALAALAMVAMAGGAAQAQLAKTGNYVIPAGLAASGKLMELGKNHLFWSGEFKGAGHNSQGGFLKIHAWDCSGSNDIVDGTASIAGFCRVTDQDGDLAFVRYAGKFPAGQPTTGKGEWIGGTGKYQGLRGGHNFTCTNVGVAEASCIAEGKYELP